MVNTVAESKNKIQSIKHLRRGLAIYKTGRSPFWMIRFRDPFSKRYLVRSSKETSRVEAIDAAYEYSTNFFKRVDSDLALEKKTSFEHYAKSLLKIQEGATKWPDSDRKLLFRKGDGILYHFGKYDVSKITTSMIREYLSALDANREKPLASSTKSKHIIIIRKVLSLAVEDEVIKSLPIMPKQKTVDSPRHAFSDEEYKRFMKAATDCAKRGDMVRGVKATMHHVQMFRFVVHSFLRPTMAELFGLKHKDIEVEGSPPHLKMTVHGGKTGKRISVTMPLCVPLYQGMINPTTGNPFKEGAYVWMPEYQNRTTAISTARRIFNHFLAAADLADEMHRLSPYSLRHYALQKRLRSSNGKVNIYTLAKNAGTSVDQLERFYLKNMAPTKEMIENLQITD